MVASAVGKASRHARTTNSNTLYRRPAGKCPTVLRRPAASVQTLSRTSHTPRRPATSTIRAPVAATRVVVGRNDLVSYEGAVDAKGRADGEGKALYQSGDLYQGTFCNGYEHGRGHWKFADGTSLDCTFQFGAAMGKGCYEDPEEGIRRHGNFVNGDLEGFGWESDDDGDLIMRGSFRAGCPVGYCEYFDDAGCVTAGCLSSDGLFNGDGITFVFPDGLTCISGNYLDGDFVRGRYGQLREPLAPRQARNPASIAKHPACSVNMVEGAQEVSAPVDGILASELLVSDHYEFERVEVRRSACRDDAGLGLFAKRRLTKGDIFSFYNGVRLSHAEVDGRDWSLNERTASLNTETVLDVPVEFAELDKYCASLGHFANHSVTPNAQYSSGFDHPRFGEIVCLRALRDITPGEEILCDYCYEHTAQTAMGDVVQDLPAWFAQERRNQAYSKNAND